MKIKDFCALKDIIKKVKNISQNRRKYLQIISDKVVESRIHETLLQLNETSNLIRKWAKDLNRQFSKNDIRVSSKYMKKVLNIISH